MPGNFVNRGIFDLKNMKEDKLFLKTTSIPSIVWGEVDFPEGTGVTDLVLAETVFGFVHSDKTRYIYQRILTL
jgi:hypothetical protein